MLNKNFYTKTEEWRLSQDWAGENQEILSKGTKVQLSNE